MRWRPIFLPLILLGGLMCLWIYRGLNIVAVWLVEGGLDRALIRYELFWDEVRMPILLVVGILCAGFFVFSAIVGFLARKRGVRNGHR